MQRGLIGTIHPISPHIYISKPCGQQDVGVSKVKLMERSYEAGWSVLLHIKSKAIELVWLQDVCLRIYRRIVYIDLDALYRAFLYFYTLH